MTNAAVADWLDENTFSLADFFDAYESLANEGKADSVGGGEFRRVLSEWVRAGCPANVSEFIYCRASAIPMKVGDKFQLLGLEPWQLIATA